MKRTVSAQHDVVRGNTRNGSQDEESGENTQRAHR